MLSYLVCYTKKKRTNVRVAFGKTWHEKWRFRGFCEIIIVRLAEGGGQGRKDRGKWLGKSREKRLGKSRGKRLGKSRGKRLGESREKGGRRMGFKIVKKLRAIGSGAASA